MLLNKVLESVLLEVVDVGSQTQRGQDGCEDDAVTHCGVELKHETE